MELSKRIEKKIAKQVLEEIAKEYNEDLKDLTSLYLAHIVAYSDKYKTPRLRRYYAFKSVIDSLKAKK